MRRIILVLLIMVIFMLPTSSLAANVPFRQRAASPDKKWVAELKKIGKMEECVNDWRLHISDQKLQQGDIVIGFRTQEVISSETWNDAWGIYDFAWSPDSRMILFVFRPYSSNSISHSNDCLGIFDIKTKQYEWLAGPVVDKMQSDYFGPGRPDFKLKWHDRNEVSFYMFKTTLQQLVGQSYRVIKVRPAGIRIMSVAKICRGFAQREQKVRILSQQIIQAMQSNNWRVRMRSFFVNPKHAKEPIERLAECQREWKNAREIMFVWFARRSEEFAIAISMKSHGSPFIVKDGRIVDVPMDLY